MYKSRFDFNNENIFYPKDINKVLNKYVIGQEYTKKVLSVAVYNHYKRLRNLEFKNGIELSKSNVLLIGPTGSGKTLLAQTLARFLKVPFAITDATTLTEAGYVGEDVENIIQRLLHNCNYNVEMVKYGIIYIDEIDKIGRKSYNPSITRDVSGEGVQQSLLKLIEGTISSIPMYGGRKHPNQDMIKIDTTNILFICGGAFCGLDKIVNDRLERNKIGFNTNTCDVKSSNFLLDKLESEDLIRFGLIPELVGRLHVLSVLDELDDVSLMEILIEPKNSIINQYRMLFKMEQVNLEIKLDALKAIVLKTIKCKTGARGLRTILEKLLLNLMYELPSIRSSVDSVIIDKDVVNGIKNPIYIYKKKIINK